MATIIGFATQFYTLWNVEEVKHYSEANGKHHHVGTTFAYTYFKKVAKSLDKVKQLYPDTPIDESLRGVNGSFKEYRPTQSESVIDDTLFPYGRYSGTLISQCNKAYHLFRLYDNKDHYQHTPRRRAFARRRLIELGELVMADKVFNLVEKYIPAGHYKYLVEKKAKQDASGHYFNEGDKVELMLRKVAQTGYESAFGFVCIITYQDVEDRLFYYKGSNPPGIYEDFENIKATIKHSEYNDLKQTMIQRVKIIEK